MKIQKLEDVKDAEYISFKKREWVYADKEHYGDSFPDFTKYFYVYTAKEQGKIVGAISIVIDMGVVCIESLLVAQDAQRSGIGTILMKKVEEEAKELGCHKIWIETGFDWSARKLYESLGYTLRCTLPNYYAHKDFVILDKDI